MVGVNKHKDSLNSSHEYLDKKFKRVIRVKNLSCI